jgi:DNA-binding transcriptional MerR regulator
MLDPGIDSTVYNVAVSSERFMRPGELASVAGISTDTLRHYERKGIIKRPGRSRNGYREYPHEVLDRVLTVQRALRIGFSLDELARVFKVRDSGGAPCREVRELAASKLRELENEIGQLLTLRDELTAIVDEWDRKLTTTPAGRAELLSSLDKMQTASKRVHPTTRLKPRQKKRK